MPKKILLADDSITIQKVVELTFSDGDYEVVATNNGAKAIQRLPEVRPDIILSDIIMPEKNGYEVCEYVKSHPEFRHIPVILLTGTFEPFDPDRAEKAGCDAVVTKPFESQSLIHRVEELIAQSQSSAAATSDFAAPEIAAPASDAFSTQMNDVHAAPTFEMPAFASGSEAAASGPWDSPAEASPYAPEPPAERIDDDPFASPPPDFGNESADVSPAVSESSFGEGTPAFREHSSDLFAGAAPSDSSSALPLESSRDWDSAPAPEAAEEAPLFPPPAPAPMPSATAEPSWAAGNDDPGATRMIPKLTLDEVRGASEASASASPFEEEGAEGGGETKMIPKLSFDDIRRMQQESTPSAFAPAAPSPFEEESVAPEAAVQTFDAPEEEQSFGAPAFSDSPSFDSASQFASAAPSPFDDSSPAEGGGETKMIPKLSFDEIQRMREAASAPIEPAPEPIALSSVEDEQPEILPFDAPSTSPYSLHTSETPFEEESSNFGGEESSDYGSASASEEAQPLEPVATFPSAVPPLDEFEAAPVEDIEEEVAPAATSSHWSATEPASITPEEPSFSAPSAPAPIEAALGSVASTGAVNLDPQQLPEEVIDRIARRVVELMSDEIIRKIAWEVVPDTAEMVVKERIRQLENEA